MKFMCAQTIDRRISTSVAPCKNCGLDTGLYPSMHKCQQQQRNPYLSPLPPLPTRQLSNNSNPLQVPRKPIHSPSNSSGSSSRFTSTSSFSSSTFSSCSSPNEPSAAIASPSPLSGKWSQFSQKLNNIQQQPLYPSDGGDGDDNSNYLNSFEAHLPEQEKKKKSLWGKVRQKQKWEQWTQHGDISKPGDKLWNKLRLAAQNMADKIPSHDDKEPESDESDWEGETHVSRILREYYVKKRRPLPYWLRDEGTTQRYTNSNAPPPITSSRRRRLWDELERRPQNYDQQQSTSSEINFGHAQQQQQSQTSRHQQTNHSDYHYGNTPSPQRNRNDNDDIRRRHHVSNNQLSTNDQPYRRQSYQTSPSLANDMKQQRRFSMGYISPTAPQRQYNNEDGRYRHPTAMLHQDRLHGPRTRPSKHNKH